MKLEKTNQHAESQINGNLSDEIARPGPKPAQ